MMSKNRPRNRKGWLAIREPLTSRKTTVLKLASFLLPLAIWCLVSYVPWIWHPYIKIISPGDSDSFVAGQLYQPSTFEKENAELIHEGEKPGTGVRANPVFLPAPDEVFRAFYTAFVTPPQSREDPWLYQSLAHSIYIIFWGFVTSAILGVPMGILAGTFDFFSKLFEPFIDFIRYMPAPAFGALCMALLGIEDGPKVAIIWIGTFFQMVLVVANTTRQLDIGLLEAAQTLGASRPRLVMRVILPGILPNLYNDMRILLGWAWTYLIIAELIGERSGISSYIYQQGHYLHYENVFAGIMMIGIIGLACDQVLSALGEYLFPYLPRGAKSSIFTPVFGALFFLPQRIILNRSRDRNRRRAEASLAGVATTAPALTERIADAPVAYDS